MIIIVILVKLLQLNLNQLHGFDFFFFNYRKLFIAYFYEVFKA